MAKDFMIVSNNSRVMETFGNLVKPQGMRCHFARSGREALDVARQFQLDMAVDPRNNRLRRALMRILPTCRIVVTTELHSVLNSADLFRRNADRYVLTENQVLDLMFARERVSAELTPAEKQTADEDLIDALIQTLEVIVSLSEMDDPRTRGTAHQRLTLVDRVAQAMIPNETLAIRELKIATLVRDISRFGEKMDETDSTEAAVADVRDRFNDRVVGTLRLLEHIRFPNRVQPILRHQFESYDGCGAPDGLRGREIPLGSRILSAVDGFLDALYGVDNDGLQVAVDPLKAMLALLKPKYDPEVIEKIKTVITSPSSPLTSVDRKPRLLIHEPDGRFANLLGLKLRNEGIDVVPVCSYDGLQEKLEAETCDLVMLSIDVGFQNAINLLVELRMSLDFQNLPIVLIGQRTDDAVTQEALKNGADEVMQKSESLEQLVVRVQSILRREEIRRQDTDAGDEKGLTGNVTEMSLPEIVQLLSMGMKTASVTLVQDEEQGTLWILSGRLVHAEAGELRAHEAAYAMLAWQSATFQIEHGGSTQEQTIHEDAMFIVMEGLRRLDESKGVAPMPVQSLDLQIDETFLGD
jgi:response regulator RpfG family c-di-GMP phosphodiesterase